MIAFSGKTHIIIGIIIWLFFPTLNLVAVCIGSLFPDSDHKRATMGKVLPLWIFFKHRGFTHSVIAALLFSFVTEQLITGVGLSFFVGYISHILGDKLS